MKSYHQRLGRSGRWRFGSQCEEGRRTRRQVETDAAPQSRQAMVVDGRTLVKAGQEATASGGYGLDKGPAIDRTRRQEIEGQERASGRPAPSTTQEAGSRAGSWRKRKWSLKSARRPASRECGQGKRLEHSLEGEQNQKERTFDVLPKPAKLISYRHVSSQILSPRAPRSAQPAFSRGLPEAPIHRRIERGRRRHVGLSQPLQVKTGTFDQ